VQRSPRPAPPHGKALEPISAHAVRGHDRACTCGEQLRRRRNAVVLEIRRCHRSLPLLDYVVREMRGVSRDNTASCIAHELPPGGIDHLHAREHSRILASPVLSSPGARRAHAGERRNLHRLCKRDAAMAPGTNLGRRHPDSLGRNPGLPRDSPAAQRIKRRRGEGSSNSSEPADAESRTAVNRPRSPISGPGEIKMAGQRDWAPKRCARR